MPAPDSGPNHCREQRAKDEFGISIFQHRERAFHSPYRGHPLESKNPHHSDKGRRGLTAPQVLRALVLMRVKNWDYRELRERIADGITLRAFTDFHCGKVPKHDAFNRSFNRLTPATLKGVNDLVVEAAVKLGLEDGSKLRVHTTVVETDIHHPTDNTLLWDVVRVLTQLLGRLGKALELRRIAGFRDRSRAACRAPSRTSRCWRPAWRATAGRAWPDPDGLRPRAQAWQSVGFD